MLVKLQGIVLNHVKLAEKKQIIKIYTREQGIRSFLAQVSNSPKSKIKPAVMLPLSLIELNGSEKENRELGKLSEVRCQYIYLNMYSDMYKTSICSFLVELLSKCLQESESNEALFDFIHSSLQWLDLAEESISNFHLYFMAELCRHLGFYPQNNYSKSEPIFDLMEGAFVSNSPMHPHYLRGQESEDFSTLFTLDLKSIKYYHISHSQRSTLLNNLISYFQLHVPNMRELKSVQILKETFS